MLLLASKNLISILVLLSPRAVVFKAHSFSAKKFDQKMYLESEGEGMSWLGQKGRRRSAGGRPFEAAGSASAAAAATDAAARKSPKARINSTGKVQTTKTFFLPRPKLCEKNQQLWPPG